MYRLDSLHGRTFESTPVPVFDSASSVSVHLPEGYEDHYAYPLVIWLHGEGQDEKQLQEVMPGISDRNYVGLSFRGLISRNGQFSWPDDSLLVDEFLNTILETVLALRKSVNIHTERIYIAGQGNGGRLAIRLLMERPEWFQGAISVAGQLPVMDRLCANYRFLQEKRVLLTNDRNSNVVSNEDLKRASRVFHAAGMTVSTRAYDEQSALPANLLNDINYWIMQGVSTATLV